MRNAAKKRLKIQSFQLMKTLGLNYFSIQDPRMKKQKTKTTTKKKATNVEKFPEKLAPQIACPRLIGR